MHGSSVRTLWVAGAVALGCSSELPGPDPDQGICRETDPRRVPVEVQADGRWHQAGSILVRVQKPLEPPKPPLGPGDFWLPSEREGMRERGRLESR